MKDTIPGKTVQASQTVITELMIPAYANFGGKIHGGILMSLMDKVAYATAAKHSGRYCVTVSVDTIDFLEPVEVGELLSLKASINHVGNSSMVVGIKVISENVKTGLIKHTNTCYFTMVAKDDDNRPAKVPPLILQTKAEVKRFVEAIKRKKVKKQYEHEMKSIKQLWDKDEIARLLENERCINQWKET